MCCHSHPPNLARISRPFGTEVKLLDDILLCSEIFTLKEKITSNFKQMLAK